MFTTAQAQAHTLPPPTTSSKRGPQQQQQQQNYNPSGSSSNVLSPTSHMKLGASPQHSAPPSGPQRAAAHTSVRPKKYIGHYDIADRTFQMLSRHRAAACILFWSLTILLDILLQLPIEWFFLFYFILALVFRIFFIGGHIVHISIGAMCVSNAVVFYTVPFSFTSPFATGVAFGLMVSLIHGLNLKGVILAMTMYMLKPYIERQTLIAALNPPTVPSIVFLAPLASFCSAFGVLWLLYDLFGYLHASTDDLREFFGITLPAPSIITLKDVKDRSITLNWQCSSQATISKHLIEIDGLIIGESGKQETSVVIQGLYPDNTYRIRLWAITTRNWKTPSDYIVVRTLASVPVELELSSENARRESEQIKQLIKESEDMQHLIKDVGQDSIETNVQEQGLLIGEGIRNVSPVNTTLAAPSVFNAQSVVSGDGRMSSPTSTVSDDQILTLKIELEGKEAAHAILTQQLADLEKQYQQQEDSLKDEIATLREQQKLEDEPRQQAKSKLKDLQECLRESEVHKSKVEKEHRAEVEKRQRMTEQLESKQRKLESLQQTLRQSEDRLQSEKRLHRQQMQELEAALKKRSEDVQSAESSLKALQESHKSLCDTIEVKEIELQKLQATIHSPKGHLMWEQKSKDLDAQCALLTQQLSQYKAENQQLQDRLAEASKNVMNVRSARENRKAQAEARKASRSAAAAATAANNTGSVEAHHAFADHQTQNYGSNWVSAGWNNSPGTHILNGLFQDNAGTGDAGLSPVRRTTGPPPGLAPKISASEANRSMESNAPGYGRSRRDSGSQGNLVAPGSPLRSNGQIFEPQRYGMSPRARFQAAGQVHSPPIAHGQPHWGAQKSGSVSASVGNRSPLMELDAKGSPTMVPNQPFNYHRFFAPPTSADLSSGMLSENNLANGHQMNEQNVIKSMFESPETLDLRHHIRTVGSHSSLTAQSKILPSHLRPVSTPGVPSPLPSPVTATLPPFQSSPSWDFRPIARPGTLGRLNGQAEGSSSSLIYSDPSSPTSPQVSSFHQSGVGFGRKPLLKDSTDRGFWSGYESVDGGWNRGQDNTYGSMMSAHPDPWAQGDGRFKQNRQSVGPSSRDLGSGISMEGMLPSPNGSSVSSLDTGTPLSVDALVFADHYFSNRSHRGFEAPSSLSSTAFTASTTRQPTLETGVGSSKQGPGRSGQDERTLPASGESDIFGYGLKLNPFGWTIPSEVEDMRESRP